MSFSRSTIAYLFGKINFHLYSLPSLCQINSTLERVPTLQAIRIASCVSSCFRAYSVRVSSSIIDLFYLFL